MTQENKLDARQIVLSSSDGFKSFSYYLPETKNQLYTISFDYEYITSQSSPAKTYLMFSEDAINLESDRAKVVESNLDASIKSEVERAKIAESNLNAAIDFLAFVIIGF